MSIASEITRISGNVADAYTAANAKGATMPVTQNSDNLATTISTIQTGTTPTGTKSITANGVYDVTDFASADVQVPTAAPSRYLEYSLSPSGVLKPDPSVSSLINLSGAKDVGAYVLAFAYNGNTSLSGSIVLPFESLNGGDYSCSGTFQNCTGITSVDLSSLTTISSNYALGSAFSGCTGLVSVNFGPTYIGGVSCCQYMFNGCINLASVDLSSLSWLAASSGFNYMFNGCTGLTSADLSGLIEISAYSGCQYMFQSCTSLASVDLSGLVKASGSGCMTGMFKNCTSLTSLSFPNMAYALFNYNSSFSNTLQGVTGCTVHFPSDWQTAMSSWSSITNGMGGTNTTVLFDLPAVTTLDLSNIKTLKYFSLRNFGSSGSNGAFPNITKVNLGGLISVSSNQCMQNAFKNCGNLATVDMSKLVYVTGSEPFSGTFNGCSISNIDLSSLAVIDSTYTFGNFLYGATITSISFPALRTVTNVVSSFSSMLNGVTGVTVHFPSNLSSYHISCGGTGTTVLYDLPATNILTGADTVEYERNPKYDTATALAWRVKDSGTYSDPIVDFTPYYTSGTTDPAVSDTIYSDSACTTPVTTISSIA